jgi:hypothetical protein
LPRARAVCSAAACFHAALRCLLTMMMRGCSGTTLRGLRCVCSCRWIRRCGGDANGRIKHNREICREHEQFALPTSAQQTYLCCWKSVARLLWHAYMLSRRAVRDSSLTGAALSAARAAATKPDIKILDALNRLLCLQALSRRICAAGRAWHGCFGTLTCYRAARCVIPA